MADRQDHQLLQNGFLQVLTVAGRKTTAPHIGAQARVKALVGPVRGYPVRKEWGDAGRAFEKAALFLTNDQFLEPR
ncbi:MAG: hypothetical protein C0524_12520 [Rhodobacter sp.]|nr:hypothetical protein [Rhodobacter sp.]